MNQRYPMAAAAQHIPALLTLDEYLRTDYQPDCDFVDGHLEERNVGEYEHGTLQAALAAWFFNHRREWKIRVAAEYRTRVTPSRVRIPDLSVFPEDDLPEKVRVTPPLLAIEILSPEDRIHRVILRLNDFLDMGVSNVWVIDPEERVAYDYSGRSLKLVEGALLTIPNSLIYLDLPELFSALD